MMNTLALFLSLALPQDLEKSRAELRKAVAAGDAAAVDAAVEKVSAADSKRAVDILLEAYGDCAKELKPLWEEKYKALQDTQAAPKFDRALDEKARDVERRIRGVEALKRRIVAGLAAAKSDGAVRELVAELKAPTVGGGEWTRRAGVAEALGPIPHAEALPALIEAAGRDPEPMVRVAALDALRAKKTKTPEVVDVLVSLLGHEAWGVKSTAVATLEALAAKEAVGALIEALAKADGRLRYEINQALIAFTAVNKHGDYPAWKAWWDANQAEVRAGTYVPKKEERADNQAGGGTTFYGIPIHSRHVVFVLDRSGSMREPSEWELPKDVATGPSMPGADLKPAGNRKIDIARWQLKRALAMLPDGIEFNLIFYNHQWTGMSEQMVKLGPATRKQAFEFIDALEPDGRTNIYDPLERGLQFAPAGGMPEKLPKSAPGPRPTVATGDRAPKGYADTVYLLSDGLPNTGQIPDPAGIVAKIAEINKGRKVTIHTIGVFGSGDRDGAAGADLLKKLSADSGGIYKSGGAAEKKMP